MSEQKRYELFCAIINELDRCTDLINRYDRQLHDYRGVIMYQAESQMIKAIGNHPGITAAELAKIFDKTSSACSQLIRKLKQKGWVEQSRNEDNSREYNLSLTDQGKEIYLKHKEFESACYKRSFAMLEGISEDEMESCIKIQKRLNESFQMDVDESKHL